MRFRKKHAVVPVVLGGLIVAGMAGTALAQQPRATAAKPAAGSAATAVRPWTTAGGDVGIRWNRDLARDLGIAIVPQSVRATRASDGSERFTLAPSGLSFRVDNGYLREVTGGALQVRGGYQLQLDGGAIDLRGFRVVPRKVPAGTLPEFDIVDASGTAWFHVDHLMHELFADDGALTVSSADIRISDRLARRLGQPHAAGWALGELQFDVPVKIRGSGDAQPLSDQITWHGDPAPDGGIYENDLFMLSTSAQYSRCQGCTGNEGSGEVVFTPSSTLKNNVNEGSIAATVPGDPLGTSSVLWTASIPWYQKFTSPSPPYGNDQHPYLIWNMYRLNTDGSLEQIGRSGVKQAYLTTNGACLDSNDHHGHALGRGCTDTYSAGNNDYTQGLSPRTEILPATGQWGRCGSTFDPDCNGAMNTGPGDEYWQRLIVNESQISPTANPGADYLFESWYLAREDVNIYNSMSTLEVTPQRSGSTWSLNSTAERLGSAFDRWYAIGARQGVRNPKLDKLSRHMEEVVVDGARAKVAVKISRLPGGLWQYHYAVMNYEFAFAETSGQEPNLRIDSTQGFDGFSLSTGSGAAVSDTVFRDGDLDAGNDWAFTTSADAIRWDDASGNHHSLGWGELYSFTVLSTKAPARGTATLHADNAPTPTSYDVDMLVPGR